MKMITPHIAKGLAYELHEGQFRANGETPYIEHPKMVAELVEKFGGSEFCIALAWLHDVLEESADKFCEKFNIEHVKTKVKFMFSMRDRWDMLFITTLDKLSDHWDCDQKFIRDVGKVPYLASLLIHADENVLLVKLCDMLANIAESNGTRMTQEDRYYKAIQCMKMTHRKGLKKKHKAVIKEIERLYNEHKTKSNA